MPSRGHFSATAGPPSEASNFPVVGIGASAGGLDACRKFLDAMPAGIGMAFILVQHLDPTHESMMVDLLAAHTALAVRQAVHGMAIEPDHLYIIPPGTYLAIADGTLYLSWPQARHGARLPFDFFLNSLAADCGARAVCVILSGSGGDGSLGLKAVKENGGLVIAQDPDEAGHDGMPRSAIATGLVDAVLPVSKIPDALGEYGRRVAASAGPGGANSADGIRDGLAAIVDLLRAETDHDFTLYKPGTLQRRIDRRMALTGVAANDVGRYLDILRSDPGERDILASDLLINVTSFFRDPKVFDFLAEKIVPDLVRNQSPDQPIRIWIAGCSTGEETYSLAMLFHERIEETRRGVKLKVFASDVDPDAVTRARDGFYPETIAADVSPERLARFFSKENYGYRISPVLRDSVIFTIQNVLADPPFSRLDLISCRNLLIYLRPEAQTKIISLFHFALREGGLLLLGNAETIVDFDGRFEAVAKEERLYRHIGRAGPAELRLAIGDGKRVPIRPGLKPGLSRETALAELCRRLVLDSYAPAAVLIDPKHQCLYSLGPTERYLRLAPGRPTHDLLAMVHVGMRARLRAAILRASQDKRRVVVAGGQAGSGDDMVSFNLDVRPVSHGGAELLLVCFVDEPKGEPRQEYAAPPGDSTRAAELEQELEATKTELQNAIRDLEISSEEQMALNEEASSVNEEYQSTNEELVTSKEELQSLNEELTALNSQLQETLERQRTTANDLQNVLYSTDVATVFLDAGLNIRLFTPATKLLFGVIPSDVGRPLADLHALTVDPQLTADAADVLRTLAPVEREIEALTGAWYVRRILPYRTQEGGVAGVVITYVDISERRHTADALRAAERQAQLATIAKSRFLAAASHDLRQPLQTLALLQGLLAKTVVREKAKKLVVRLDETLGAMSGMLNALLDINQIEAGTVLTNIVRFPVGDLLERLRNEFTYLAGAQGLTLRVVPSSATIESDPRLLEQMIRNLLSNALKYTKHGKVLLGCRRGEGVLNIEIWDTGIGIAAGELHKIFEEYHQVDNEARERSRGLGLGLSIVQRLAKLLGHRVRVQSRPGKGSVFAIGIALPTGPAIEAGLARENWEGGAVEIVRRSGAILVVEDDPQVRDLLKLLLRDEGHRAVTAQNGAKALDLVAREKIHPDLILADFNLPMSMNGIEVVEKLRQQLHFEVPAIILTGDTATSTLRDIARHDCVPLNKPVKLKELTQTIRRLLATPAALLPRVPPAGNGAQPPVIFVVDDDRNIREQIRAVLEEAGRAVEDYESCEAFLEAYRPGRDACLLIDAQLPGMKGLELLQLLSETGRQLPSIMITGNGDVPTAVQAMKMGAVDLIEKPISGAALLAKIAHALELSRDSGKLTAWRDNATSHVAGLTARQRQIMDMVLAGHPSKNIAADLGISQRTVENHRASIMKKTGAKSLPELARLAFAADGHFS